jgi:hypothetical protein
MAELDPTGRTVQIGDLGIRTPSLTGSAEPVVAAGPGLRAAGGTSPEFQAALDRAEIETTHVVTMSATEIPGFGGGAAPGRGGGGDTTTIELDVPQAAEGFEQAVLSVDELGVTTWSFAPRVEPAPGVRGAGVIRTFKIRRWSGPPPEAGAQANRSIFGEVGKRVLKVIAFPIGQVVGQGVNSFIHKWEVDHQGYGVRDYRTDNYTGQADYFDGNKLKWQELAKGRTLLFVHGTFSRAAGAFNLLPVETMTNLQSMYENRVIAFDHLSISEDPIENMEWLLDTIPDGLSLDFDIVCHSRGGLVSRSLTERTDPFPGSRNIRVHRTALVGATNNGTILADVKHWNDLVDTLSTVLNAVGIGVGETIDLVLSFVRQIAVAAFPKLRGLACMVPGSEFLTTLNAKKRGTNEYLVIASNYEPTDHQLRSYFRNVVTDGLFGEKPNDCMVRVDSVCGSDDAGAFAPVTDQLLLDDRQGIEHARYFGNQAVADRLVEWLGAGL